MSSTRLQKFKNKTRVFTNTILRKCTHNYCLFARAYFNSTNGILLCCSNNLN